MDNPQRDLPGLTLVAWELCRRGVACFLTPMNLRWREIWGLQPNLVMLNHCRTIYDELLESLTEAGIAYGLLDTEGGVFSRLAATPDGEESDEELPYESYEKTLSQRQDLRDRVALVCSWNEPVRRTAAKRGWFPADRMVTTGPARSDYYSTRWREAVAARTPDLNHMPSPLVMLNASYPLANPRFNTPEKEREQLARNYSFSEEYVHAIVEGQQATLDAFIRLANRLKCELPDVNFVLRPHPFEGDAIYRDRLDIGENLRYERMGTIDEWLIRAHAIVHTGCSTSIEATLMGLPAFCLESMLDQSAPPATRSVSALCGSEDELIESVRAAAKGEYVRPDALRERAEAMVRATFHSTDGHACERIATAIESALHASDSRPRPEVCRRLHWQHVGRLGWRTLASARVKQWLGKSMDYSIWQGRRNPQPIAWDEGPKAFNVETVRRIVDSIEVAAKSNGTRSAVAAVGSSLERGDYKIPHPRGRSVSFIPGEPQSGEASGTLREARH